MQEKQSSREKRVKDRNDNRPDIDKDSFVKEIRKGECDWLIVDGNNLFFVDDQIRKVVLKGRGQKKESQIITDLVRNYAMAMGFKHTLLIFDGKGIKTEEPEINFFMDHSLPNFQISDDYIANFAAKNK